TTMERLRPARMRPSTMIGIAVGALILVLLAVAVLRSLGDANAPHTARPPSPTTATTSTTGSDHPADPEPDQSAARQSAALSMLEDKLRSGGASLDLGALGGQVDQLIGQAPAKPLLDRARVLRSRIADLVQARATADLERDLSELRGQVLKLDEDHDYESALKRVEAFRGKDEPAVKDKVASLHDVVTKARDSYLTALHDRIQLAVAGRNLQRLKELSEQLPPALLDSDLDKELKMAIKSIESDIQTQQQAVLTRVTADLARWNLAAVVDAGPTNRTLMAGSGNGKQLDTLVETARRLDQFTAALGAQFEKLKSSTGRGVRYKGVLNGWTDPDMVGADSHGLQLEVVGGGTASPRWQEMQPDVLNVICSTVLPKEEAEQYRAALQMLASVRISSGGAPEK
ncbi:MAG: hypothetical protein H0X38_13600, partial [Planctomycetes bacterium]|nr:hypothetical protein [Planctomycetota bacterium]